MHRRALGHDGDVRQRHGRRGQCRRVAGHDCDLWDQPGGAGGGAQDLRLHVRGDNALLPARAGGVIDADQRHTGLGGQVVDLEHLLGVDLADLPVEDGGVLGEDADAAAVDKPVARDHAVGGGLGLVHLVRLDAVLG